MRRITLFVEDFGHEAVLRPLLENRFAPQYGVEVSVRDYSVRGGYGVVENEFRQYVNELLSYEERLPDLVVVATDANCHGFLERRRRMQAVAESIKDSVVYAIPDPHIERWLLLDAAAFKSVLGEPCRTPDLKCNRDRYKSLLAQAVQRCGTTPLLGGVEHAEDIVRHMDLERVRRRDPSFGALLKELNTRFRLWARS